MEPVSYTHLDLDKRQEVRLTQQRQASGQFINLRFAATYGKADILKIRFGRSGHLFYEFFINIAALGLFCEVYHRQVLSLIHI